MLNIPIVLGSVRQGRKSEAVARWFLAKALEKGLDSQLIDFKTLPLPFYDGDTVPVVYFKKGYPNENVQKWSEIAKKADGFVIVTPEYNHGYPAVLKNALDWGYLEFEKKPFGIVGVSDGRLGGARMAEQLKLVIQNFNAMPIRETVMVGAVEKYFDGQGSLMDESLHKKAEGFLESLAWWSEALKKAREKDSNEQN